MCNLLDIWNGKYHQEAFYTAALWLHQNHPKTLLCNLSRIAESFGLFRELVPVLHRVLVQGQEDGDGTCRRRSRRDSKTRAGKKAAEREVLHDGVSDFLVKHLKADIEKLKLMREEQKLKLKQSDGSTDYYDDDGYDVFYSSNLYISDATSVCLPGHLRPTFPVRDTLLCESIAKKLFPPEEHQGCADESSLVRRLTNEVLPPLTNAYLSQNEPQDEACEAQKHLEELKVSGYKSHIFADALFPHEILRYVHHWNFGQAAELQWKTMVEDILLNQGKFKKYLAVCDINSKFMDKASLEVSFALGLLLSEQSEEPWKGKVVSSRRWPELQSIQGGDNLRYKCEFVRGMHAGTPIGLREVFDLVLQEAVNGSLKSEQMIDKVFVFSHEDFDDAVLGCWEADYKAIQCEYKEKGYGDAVPHVMGRSR